MTNFQPRNVRGYLSLHSDGMLLHALVQPHLAWNPWIHGGSTATRDITWLIKWENRRLLVFCHLCHPIFAQIDCSNAILTGNDVNNLPILYNQEYDILSICGKFTKWYTTMTRSGLSWTSWSNMWLWSELSEWYWQASSMKSWLVSGRILIVVCCNLHEMHT